MNLTRPMKRAFLFASLLAIHTSFAADAPPPVSAKQAISIAEQSLATRGLEKELFVASVTLERESVLKAKSFWFVK